MTDNDYTIARDLKLRLASAVSLVDFRVFGSRARGEADEYSYIERVRLIFGRTGWKWSIISHS